jgi:hypothetical protein
MSACSLYISNAVAHISTKFGIMMMIPAHTYIQQDIQTFNKQRHKKRINQKIQHKTRNHFTANI